jgi:lantibiotic biosynthesis protein
VNPAARTVQRSLDARITAGRLAEALAVPPPPEPDGDRSPASPRWRGQSLAQGAAGIAVLHAALANAGQADWDRVRGWLACAVREELSTGPGAGLWYGAPAVAFAMTTAAPPGTCQRAQADLDTAVRRLARTYLAAAQARMGAATRPARREYDLVHGLTGLGAYLLRQHPGSALVREVLAYLVALTEPVAAGDTAGTDAPGWWASDIPAGKPPERFRGGQADLGMAHGIAGPLALLALSMRHGVMVDGQADAIHRICAWLDTWRQDSPAGPWWPERVTCRELATAQCTQPGPRRPSWCYGTPGLARAQQLAGLALGDHDRQRVAEHAMAACLTDPGQLAQLTDPALCHGWAGVLLTAWHAAADAQAPGIARRLPMLIDALLRHAPGCGCPGLIEGSAGIALTLHTITSMPGTSWESCLLIS